MTEEAGVVKSRVGREAANEYGEHKQRSIPMHQIVLSLALLLTLVAYRGSLSYQFVYDDHGQILGNSALHSWRFAPHYFTQNVWESVTPGVISNYYRPFFLLWLRLNHALFGLRPWGWHLTSVLAHLGVTLSVYFLAVTLIGDRLTAAVAGLVFGLHPVHVEPVVWISGVTEPLLAILFIPCFVCNLKARKGGSRSRVWLALSLLLYLGAMLAKETAVVLPGLILLYEWLYWHPEREHRSPAPQRQRIGNAVRCALPYLALTPPYLALRATALRALHHTITALPLSTVIFTAPALVWFYLKRLVWPVGMSAWYNIPYVQTPGRFNFALPAAGVAGVALILWGWARSCSVAAHGSSRGSKARAIVFATAWLLLPILPVLDASLLPRGDFVHDRYLYLPSAGFAMIAALAWSSLKVRGAKRYVKPAIQFSLAGVATLLFVWGIRRESIVWSTDLLLYQRGLINFPHSSMLRTRLGISFAEEGHYDEAMRILQEVTRSDPHQWEANYNLGLLYYRFGRLEEAEACFKRATAILANEPRAFLYLGLTQLKLGRVEEAAASIYQSARINPNVNGVHFARGIVLKLQGDLRGALAEFNQELALNPEQQAAREQIEEIERLLRAVGG